MIAIGRHINGITLNELEYVLDDDGDIMAFQDEDEAKKFLLANGCTEDELEWMVFEEMEEKGANWNE